jgi:hypothetical protein
MPLITVCAAVSAFLFIVNKPEAQAYHPNAKLKDGAASVSVEACAGTN